MRIILLLSSFLSFLFSFEELFHYNIKNFDIIEKDKVYRLILKNQRYISYKKDGFKVFLPYFTKEFNLKLLRYNSTGYIDGYLSFDKTFSNILTTNKDLKYYLTDYASKKYRQLDFLLKGYTIPYHQVTAVSIEAYNIPPYIYKKFNRYLYFYFIHSYLNNLRYVVYSFYIDLDKKAVDAYLKRNHMSFKTFLNYKIYKISLTKPKKQKLYKKPIKNKTVKEKKPSYSLHYARILFMKDFGYIPLKHEYKLEISSNLDKINEIVNKIEEGREFLNENFNSTIQLAPKKKLSMINRKIDDIIEELNSLNCSAKIIKPKCEKIEYNKECFKTPNYYHDYLYFQMKKDNIPNTDEIVAYGNYKTFNDIGKYFFERGEFKKAEVFLQKALVLKKDPIIYHNLGVLYAFSTPLKDIKKAISYFKKSNLDIDNYNIGVFYYLGWGVKESDKMARIYFEKAKSIPFAKENLEIMNKYKIGIK